VGELTAMAVHPGGFWGKDAVEGRAADLARDLARAIKENRRYPATDRDLRFYHFMGYLVKSQKDTIMKHDFKHWQEHGFFQGFEAYIQQTPTEISYDPGIREAWVQEMIEAQKTRRKEKGSGFQKPTPRRGPKEAGTCGELLRMMPLGFDPSAAGDLKAVFQFQVTGDENFTAHLAIANGICTYHDGPSEKPDLQIKTPAEIWLKISKGELSGQKAFLEGQYKVEGDMTLLLKLKSLFPG
jgi:hypothetical protein